MRRGRWSFGTGGGLQRREGSVGERMEAVVMRSGDC